MISLSDEYFVERVKVIDELAEQRKKKVLEIIQWSTQFKVNNSLLYAVLSFDKRKTLRCKILQ